MNYCCYGMYADVGHDADCPTQKHSAAASSVSEDEAYLRRNRGLLRVAVAPHAAANHGATVMREATDTELLAARDRFKVAASPVTVKVRMLTVHLNEAGSSQFVAYANSCIHKFLSVNAAAFAAAGVTVEVSEP